MNRLQVRRASGDLAGVARRALEQDRQNAPDHAAVKALLLRAQQRLERLQALLRAQQESFNRGMVGRVLPILFERAGRHAGQIAGRTPYLQAVHAHAPARWIGAVHDVTILAVGPNSLTAAPVGGADAGPLAAPERISA